MERLIIFIVKMALSIFVLLFKGYVFCKLWLWLIVSTFDVMELSLAQGYGLALIISLLTTNMSKLVKDEFEREDKTEIELFFKLKLTVFMIYSVCLLHGYVIQLFI